MNKNMIFFHFVTSHLNYQSITNYKSWRFINQARDCHRINVARNVLTKDTFKFLTLSGNTTRKLEMPIILIAPAIKKLGITVQNIALKKDNVYTSEL